MAELRVGRLKGDRRRVVDRAGDPGVVEMRAQGVPVRRTHDEQVVDVVLYRAWAGHRDNPLGVLQGGADPLALLAAALVPVPEPGQFDLEDRGLERVEAVGTARHLVMMAGPLAVGAEQSGAGGRVLRVGGGGASVPPG